jgi:hypothetical protein
VLKIIVDFNNLTPDGERVLVTQNTNSELNSKLKPGMRVLLHETGDFEVEAIVETVEISEGVVWWYGLPDWTTRHDLI